VAVTSNTVSGRVQLKKGAAGMSLEGKRVLRMLVEDYHMPEPDAVRFLLDGGPALSIALLQLQGRK